MDQNNQKKSSGSFSEKSFSSKRPKNTVENGKSPSEQQLPTSKQAIQISGKPTSAARTILKGTFLPKIIELIIKLFLFKIYYYLLFLLEKDSNFQCPTCGQSGKLNYNLKLTI